MKKQWLISLIFPLILFSGCSSALVAAVSTTDEPTMLQVQRVNTETENHYAPFSARAITNQQVVQRLWSVMQALPPFVIPNPPGILFCPNETEVKYQLVFLHDHSILQEALYDPSGCPTLRIGKDDVRIPEKAFQQIFAQVVGIAMNDLVPMPLFSCNIRTPCPSPTP